MSDARKPGCQGLDGRPHGLDDGTSCRHQSPTPGPVGVGPGQADLLSTLRGTISEWSDAAGTLMSETAATAAGYGKSALLSLLDTLPIKQASPVSTALLKHYVERSGAPYELEQIPEPWQDWIVKATRGRPGHYSDLNPYNSGLFDLRNSLGHFSAVVESNGDGTNTYLLSDTYQFGFIKRDTAQRGRHGFPVGHVASWRLEKARSLLPKKLYWNPGGFTERWELKVVGKETILFIPQQYLAEQGRPFEVKGQFVR